jgi:hypothetical protein
MEAMATLDLRFAADEKSIKNLAPTLVGKEMSYWEESRLYRGRVTAAEVARDRYGNPFIQVEIEPLTTPEPAGA